MKQLTMGAILSYVKSLQQEEKLTIKEVAEIPIYIGDDDELNGIHTAWFINTVIADDEDCADLVEMINENRCNVKFCNRAVLIS